MQEKAKLKPKQGMSRRQFLQVGIATGAIASGAGILALWGKLFSEPEAEIAHCEYTWGPNTTRINESNTAILREAFIADGMNPARAEVHDRAMEYETCYDTEGNILKQELLYQDNERAIVVFTAGDFAMNEGTHTSAVEAVLEALANIESFRVQDVEVQLSNGEDTLIWQAHFYTAQTSASDELYNPGRTTQP